MEHAANCSNLLCMKNNVSYKLTLMKGTDPDIQPKMPTMPSTKPKIQLLEMLLGQMYYTSILPSEECNRWCVQDKIQ
jgi:hypothetical protein